MGLRGASGGLSGVSDDLRSASRCLSGVHESSSKSLYHLRELQGYFRGYQRVPPGDLKGV